MSRFIDLEKLDPIKTDDGMMILRIPPLQIARPWICVGGLGQSAVVDNPEVQFSRTRVAQQVHHLCCAAGLSF